MLLQNAPLDVKMKDVKGRDVMSRQGRGRTGTTTGGEPGHTQTGPVGLADLPGNAQGVNVWAYVGVCNV